MNAWTVRRFLLRQPRPTAAKVHRDGGITEMAIKRVGQNWSKLAESIVALEPELIEVYATDGKLLRAVRPDSEVELSENPQAAPNVLLEDPETARLTHFANLIHRAYEHSTQIAFSKLIELVERIDARSDAIEQRLERAELNYRKVLQQQVEDAFARAEDALDAAQDTSGSPLEQMASAFLQGANQRTTNGKGKATT